MCIVLLGINYPLPDVQNTPLSILSLFSLGTLSYATVLIWIILMGVSAVSATKEKLVQSTNYGVTFVKEADIIFGSEHWFHTHEITIPEYVSINPYTARRLKKIFRTPFFCHVLITHHNYYTRVK